MVHLKVQRMMRMQTTARLWRSPWLWLLAALIVGMLLSFTHGLTNWWDLRNYHIYNPWALFHHRYGIDLLPANIQGYLDPLLDIPYYLVAWVWLPDHPRIVIALTGLPYGVLLFLTLLLAREVLTGLRGNRPSTRALVLLATVAIAVSGTATWSQAFTDTGDIVIADLIVGALVLLIGTFKTAPSRPMNLRRAFVIGLLIGAAAGLKLTAVIYAPAGGLLLLAACRDWRSALRNGAVFFAGWVIAFAVLYGPWAIHLYRLTGDPLFPYFNSVFHSPFAAATGGRDKKYIPTSILRWVFYPFYWLSDKKITVFPIAFRDARFALAYALGFVMAAIAIFFRHHHSRPGCLMALFGFWIIGYAVWLPLFSILRYAVVLEVVGSIVAIGALLYLAARLLPRLPGTGRVALAGALAIATIAFAHIPNLGNIPLEAPIFQARVPKLGARPLVILANEPMGLLAPLIERTHPGATFIGIPSCFKLSSCYYTFFNYGLGRRMREKIAAHRGPMYVAYYASRKQTFPQLGLFHITVDGGHCQIMRTNRTGYIVLCPAHYTPAAPFHPFTKPRFQFAMTTQNLHPHFTQSHRWLKNECSNTVPPGRIAISWHAPATVRKVRLYLKPPTSDHRILFTAGRASGHATTGPWVVDGQVLVFTNAHGRVLARNTIRYVQCNADQ